MKPIHRLLIPLAILVAAAASGMGAVPAFAGGDNTAAAINTKDGNTVYRIAIKVTRNDTQVVTNTNIAIVYASCTGCETVAIAFQGVIMTTGVTDFEPVNMAITLNVDCDGCASFTDATQVLAQTNGQAHLTPLGSQTLASIRRDLNAIRNGGFALNPEDPTNSPLALEVNRLADKFTCLFSPNGDLPGNRLCSTYNFVYNQLVPAGNS